MRTARSTERNLHLRVAGLGDLTAIEQIVQLAYSPYVRRLGQRPPPMDFDYGQRVRDGMVTLAEGDEVLGLIVLVRHPDHLFIENVAVTPDAQHQGVGRMLLAHAEDCAREFGVLTTRLYTNVLMRENRRLYSGLGYVERGHLAQGGLGRVEMVKHLG